MTVQTPQIVALLAQLADALTTHEDRQPEPAPLPERLLLTVEEAAYRLGIGRTQAFQLIRLGDLKTVRIGRLRRVHKDEVAAYAARLARGTEVAA